jgi:hypothetical protein
VALNSPPNAATEWKQSNAMKAMRKKTRDVMWE